MSKKLSKIIGLNLQKFDEIVAKGALYMGLDPRAWRRNSTSRWKQAGNSYVITGTVTPIFGSGAMTLLQQQFS